MLTKTYRRFTKVGKFGRIMQQRAGGGSVSTPRQMFEMGYLWLKNGITPGYYYAAGLDRKKFSWKQKREFLRAKKFESKLKKVNRARYGFVTLNKIVTYGLLRTFNIATPPFFGVINASGGQTFDGRPLRTAADFEKLAQRVGISEVCFKYVGGWRGYGFYKVRLELDRVPTTVVIQPDGPRMTLERFWNTTVCSPTLAQPSKPETTYGYLCQEVVDQHPVVAALHPESLNTARLWLFQAEPGKWGVFAAILRMGVGTMCVDNSGQGGIFSRIDLASGRLDAATNKTPEHPTFALHPTTEAQIEGLVLPMWDQVLPLCYRACAAFPFLGLLGIDIAFAKARPLVIELEAEPHSTHQIAFGHGVGPMLDKLTRNGAVAGTG